MALFSATGDLAAAKFGEHAFKGAVAGKYLSKYGESAALLDTPAWTATKSDVVASAIMDWAKANGASTFCHQCVRRARAQRARARLPRRRCTRQRTRRALTPRSPRRFQPMGASGFRHGQTGQVYNMMVEFGSDGAPKWAVRRCAAPPRRPRARRRAVSGCQTCTRHSRTARAGRRCRPAAAARVW